MRVIEAGHIYRIDVFDSHHLGICPQEWITFMKRTGPGYPGNTGEPHSGTNCQELLRVLINRTRHLEGQAPDWRNIAAINSLRHVLMCYESRAAERAHRILSIDIATIETYPTCPDCGHIFQEEHPHQNCPSGGQR